MLTLVIGLKALLYCLCVHMCDLWQFSIWVDTSCIQVVLRIAALGAQHTIEVR